MKPIFSLAMKGWKHEWKQSVKMMVAYALCTCFIVAEGFLVYSYIESAKEETLNTYGEQSGFLAGCTPQTIPKLEKDPNIDRMGLLQTFAWYTVPDAVYNTRISIGVMDQNAQQLCRVGLASGRMPQSEREIVLERSAAAKLRGDAVLGKTLTMQWDVLDASTAQGVRQQEVTVTVVGILRDFSEIQIASKDTGVALPSIFMTQEAMQGLTTTVPQSICALKFKEESAAGQTLESYAKQGVGTAYSVNSMLDSETQPQQAPVRMETLGVVLLLVTALFSILLLFSLSVITRKNRKKRIALLKVAGFTNNEVISYFSMQGILQLLVGLVAGAGLGLLLSRIMIKSMGAFVHFFWRPLLLPLSMGVVFLAAVAVLLSGVRKDVKKTVIAALREYSAVQPAKTTSSFTTERPLLLWAGKSVLLNKGEAVSSSIAVLFSMLIIIVGGFVSNGISSQADQLMPADLSLMVYDGGFMGPLEIPNDISYGMADRDFQRFAESPQTGKAIGLRRMLIQILSPAETGADTAAMAGPQRDSEAYRNEKKNWGYTEEQVLSPSALSGTSGDALRLLDKYVIEGHIDVPALSQGKEIIVCRMKTDPAVYRVGDQITFTQMISDGAGGKKRVDFTVKVGAVAVMGQGRLPATFEELALGGRFLWENASFEKVGVQIRTNELYLNYKDPTQINEIQDQIKDLQYNYPEHVLVQDNFQKAQRQRETGRAFSVTTYMLTGVLTAFAMISLLVAINLKFQERRGVLATMRAVGMGKKELYCVTAAENMVQVGVAVLLGLLFGTLICVLMLTQINEFSAKNLPWLQMLLAPIVMLCITAAACIRPVHQLYRLPIVESMRK